MQSRAEWFSDTSGDKYGIIWSDHGPVVLVIWSTAGTILLRARTAPNTITQAKVVLGRKFTPAFASYLANDFAAEIAAQAR